MASAVKRSMGGSSVACDGRVVQEGCVFVSDFQHQPVLLEQALHWLRPQAHGTYIDCTIGGAGHSLALLGQQPDIQLVGIDQDKQALKKAEQALATYRSQVTLIHDNFRRLGRIAEDYGITNVQGIFMDIGVSSHQLDARERGFSYQSDAPLDMRMDTEGQQLTAYDLVNHMTQAELAKIIRVYGEERWAARIAAFIAEARKTGSIASTAELVDIIKQAIPAKARREGPHPARRTFQALRIAVNEELAALESALGQAVDLLAPAGRLVVISFHSLEDRIVKEFFRQCTGVCACPPGLPVCRCGAKQTLKILTKRPVTADNEEVMRNPRARSAKLRAAERL